MGSVHAIRERRPLVTDTPTELGEIRETLGHYVDELEVYNTLKGLRVAVHEATTDEEFERANISLFFGSSHKCVHDSAPSRSATPWKEAADVFVPANQR